MSVLIAFAVLALLLVGEHTQVGVVARLADAALLHGLAHGAVGLVGVGAVAITAVGRDGKDLAEVVAYLLFLHIEGAEAFDTGGVDEPAALAEGEHLGEGGGVHAGVVALGDLGCAQAEVGQEGVDEGTLAYAGVAREEGGLAVEGSTHLVESFTIECRHAGAVVPDGAVEVHDGIEVAALGLVVAVYLVEHDVYGDAVGLGGGEEAVDEGG